MGIITKIDLLCNLFVAYDSVLLNMLCCFLPLISTFWLINFQKSLSRYLNDILNF